MAEIFENTSLTLRPAAIGLYFAAIVFLLVWVVGCGAGLAKLGRASNLQ